MANTAQLKKTYVEQIAPALEKQFNYYHLRSEGCRYLLKEGYRKLQTP